MSSIPKLFDLVAIAAMRVLSKHADVGAASLGNA